MKAGKEAGMINTIMEAVGEALDAEFGEGYGICTEETGQGIKAPYFSIRCLESASELFRGKRYYRSSRFCIQYFPLSQDGRNRECYSVLDRLCTCLEHIPAGSLIRGTGMKGKMAGGILEFSVNYDCFVSRTEEEEPGIGEMMSHTGVKKGD